MRVAILGDYPLNNQQIWGGEQAAFSYLVKELCKIDEVDIHIFTIANSDLAGQVRAEKNGATLHLMPPFPRFELYRRFSTYQAQLNKKLAEIQPDVVHAQGALHHGYVALGSGYPAVITVHGVQREDSKYEPSFYLRMRKWLVSTFIERYCLSHTRHLIAISQYVTNYFKRMLRPDAKIYYISNAIKNDFFDLHNRSEDQTVLFAGRVMQRKGVIDIVYAFAKVVQHLPAAQLRIAGECETEKEYVQRIRDFIETRDLKQNIHLLGPLHEDAILREFANCSILASASVQENAPMVIAQAMAAAKPVVATSVGGVTEMVNHGDTGFLINVGDVDSLANAIIRLLKDPSLQTRMGHSGHKFAVKNYRADNVAKHTCDVYQHMIALGG